MKGKIHVGAFLLYDECFPQPVETGFVKNDFYITGYINGASFQFSGKTETREGKSPIPFGGFSRATEVAIPRDSITISIEFCK